MAPSATLVLAAAAVATTAGCTGAALSDPRAAAAEYGRAVEKGDARAVYSMLTEDAQRAYGLEGTRRLLADARDEISRQAKAASLPHAAVRAVAEVPYVDGERAVLEVDHDQFRVSAAAGLPSGARTPAQALGELRSALSQRSYAALLRILSSDTRAAMERDMRSIVSGLERPDSLDVKVRGETAEIEVPGGHKVVLKREAGVWRVQDFD